MTLYEIFEVVCRNCFYSCVDRVGGSSDRGPSWNARKIDHCKLHCSQQLPSGGTEIKYTEGQGPIWINYDNRRLYKLCE